MRRLLLLSACSPLLLLAACDCGTRSSSPSDLGPDTGVDTASTADADAGDVDVLVPDDTSEAPFRVVLPLGDAFTDVSVGGGGDPLTLEVELPDDLPAISCLTIDLEASLEYASFTPDSPSDAPATTTSWVRIAPASEADTVCETGECWGVYTATASGGEATSISPAVAEASVASLEVINDGAIALCIGSLGEAPAGALTVTDLVVDVCVPEGPCEEPPADFGGVWESTYACQDSCNGDTGAMANVLTVTQDGAEISYADEEGGTYHGTACGNVLTFSGGGPGWVESGHLVVFPNGTGTKRSDYSSDGECCVGHCEDQLVRVP